MLRRMPGVVTFFFMILCLLANAVFAGPRGLTVRLPSESGAAEALYKGSYALVLGNSGYKNGLDPLPGVLIDVTDVARALRLIRERASRVAAIRAERV